RRSHAAVLVRDARRHDQNVAFDQREIAFRGFGDALVLHLNLGFIEARGSAPVRSFRGAAVHQLHAHVVVDEDRDLARVAVAGQIALKLLERDLPGDGDTRQIPIFVNDDVRMELMHCRSAKGADGRRPAGFYETQIQVQNQRVTKTSEGDFALVEGDVLVVPPSIAHENSGMGPTTRLIVYTRNPVEIAQSYPVRQGVAPNKQCIWLKPSTVLDKVEEGGSGGKHFELVENADIMIETTYRSDAQRIYHRGFGQDEIAFQLSGRRATRTNQGEYM